VNEFIKQLAVSAEPAKSDLFSSIGIDFKLLALQTVAFLLLLWILKKWVYPPIVTMLDKREAMIEEAAKAANLAQKEAAKSQEATEKLLKEARKEAGAIISTAKHEAAELSSTSDKKAKERAERIVADAQDQIGRNIESAKRQLQNELVDLVAAATEKVTSEVVDAKANGAIIAKSVKEFK